MSRKIRLFLLSVFTLLAFPLQATDRTPRIVGGTEVTDLRYPWMAAIFFRTQGGENFFQGCGGSLISDRWILSAAHCFSDAETGEVTSPDDVAFLLGSVDLRTDDGIFRLVSRIIVHPGYSSETNQNDIALLELPEAVPFEPITLSNLTNPVPINGELATVAGFGTTSEGGSPSPLLLEVDVPVVSHNACLPFYESSLDQPSMLCAGGSLTERRDSCQGDSGGPLFVPRGDQVVQAGIVSFGNGCARPGIPGVYTRLATYFDWISGFVDTPPVYDGSDDDNVIAVTEQIEVLAANSRITASVATGSSIIYQVDGVNQITLETLQGDADLYVFNSSVFTTDTLICSSLSITAIDECSFDNTGNFFVAVSGFLDSDYALTVSSGGQEIVEVEIETLQIDSPVSGNLLQGTAVVYRATSGNIATLTSISGDADLTVFSSADFNLNTLICSSDEPGSSLDICDYNAGSEVFISVLGYTDASFSLVTSSGQTEPPATEPPPTPELPPAEQPTTELPPTPESPPAVEPTESDTVVTTETGTSTTDTGTSLADTGGNGGGGGGSVGYLIFLLTLLTRVKYRKQKASR